MTDDIIDDLIRSARRCQRAAKLLDEEPILSMVRRLLGVVEAAGQAASGSWFGYLATIYLDGLRPARPGEFFDVEWGTLPPSQTTGGPWREYEYQEFVNEVNRSAQVTDLAQLHEASTRARDAIEQAKADVIPTLDAVLASQNDAVLKDLRDKIADLKAQFSARQLAFHNAPKNLHTRDPRAQQGSLQAPHHVSYRCYIEELCSAGLQAEELAKLVRQAATYLQKKQKLKGRTVAKTDGKIFIGHGRSHAWRDLKDFLQDRLNLPWDEFNRESPAGKSTKERLETMLDNACFAFLVMTAEDERADGTKHARENVIHEVGLFQGRLGFERAIILLEEECSEFGNIEGLTQIRFPAGNIMAKSEEIRRVLEREKIA